MEILLWKKTKDSDLKVGLQVCYHDLNGAYTKLGTITDIIEQDGVKLYLLNTAMGAYMADELKLIKQPKLSFNDWFPTWHKAASYEYWSQSQGTGLKRAHELMRQAGIDYQKYLCK